MQFPNWSYCKANIYLQFFTPVLPKAAVAFVYAEVQSFSSSIVQSSTKIKSYFIVNIKEVHFYPWHMYIF